MRCPQCGSPDVVMSKKEDYRYTESGLKDVILKGITLYQCPKCGEEFPIIPRIKKVHEQIARVLLAKPSILTGEEFRFLRKEMRLKAIELARLMGVHKVTVSRWETNTESISPSADRLLRYIYATRKMESIAEGFSAFNAAMFSNTMQGMTRWLEAQVKLIKRTSTQHDPIIFDPSEAPVCTYMPDCTMEEPKKPYLRIFTPNEQGGCSITYGSLDNALLGLMTPAQFQPIWRVIPTDTKGTTIMTKSLEEVPYG